MKIRISGTVHECEAATERIRATFNVLEVSTFRPNDRTPGSKLGRVYIEADLNTPQPLTTRPTAVRTDRRQIGGHNLPEATR